MVRGASVGAGAPPVAAGVDEADASMVIEAREPYGIGGGMPWGDWSEELGLWEYGGKAISACAHSLPGSFRCEGARKKIVCRLARSSEKIAACGRYGLLSVAWCTVAQCGGLLQQ